MIKQIRTILKDMSFSVILFPLIFTKSEHMPINILQMFMARAFAENNDLVATDGMLKGKGQPFWISFLFFQTGRGE